MLAAKVTLLNSLAVLSRVEEKVIVLSPESKVIEPVISTGPV